MSQITNPNVITLFNKNMNYYVCSSGGCGSTIIFEYLKKFGNTYHIHDRHPPDKLCYIGEENTNESVYSEWFNKTEITEDKLETYKVIFIYRNPIEVIFSRFAQTHGPNINHMKNIKCINDGKIGLRDILTFNRDLYGLEDFFDNYTIPKSRNYLIHCIKYEQLFSNFSLFNQVLGIPDIKALYPIKHERRKKYTHIKELSAIYNSLILKMNKMSFIEIIRPVNDNV